MKNSVTIAYNVVTRFVLSFRKCRWFCNIKIDEPFSETLLLFHINFSKALIIVGVSRGYTDHHQGRAIHMADSRIH